MKTATSVQTVTNTKLAVATLALIGAAGIAAAILMSPTDQNQSSGQQCGAYNQQVCQPCKEGLIVGDTRTCQCSQGTVWGGDKCQVPAKIKAEKTVDGYLGDMTFSDKSSTSIMLGTVDVTLPRGADYVRSVTFSESSSTGISKAFSKIGLQVTDKNGKTLWNDVWIDYVPNASNAFTFDRNNSGYRDYVLKGLPTDTPLMFSVYGLVRTRELLPVDGKLRLHYITADDNGQQQFYFEGGLELQEYHIKNATAVTDQSFTVGPLTKVSQENTPIPAGTIGAQLGIFSVRTQVQQPPLLNITLSGLTAGEKYQNAQLFKNFTIKYGDKTVFFLANPTTYTQDIVLDDMIPLNGFREYVVTVDILPTAPAIGSMIQVTAPQKVDLFGFAISSPPTPPNQNKFSIQADDSLPILSTIPAGTVKARIGAFNVQTKMGLNVFVITLEGLTPGEKYGYKNAFQDLTIENDGRIFGRSKGTLKDSTVVRVTDNLAPNSSRGYIIYADILPTAEPRVSMMLSIKRTDPPSDNKDVRLQEFYISEAKLSCGEENQKACPPGTPGTSLLGGCKKLLAPSSDGLCKPCLPGQTWDGKCYGTPTCGVQGKKACPPGSIGVINGCVAPLNSNSSYIYETNPAISSNIFWKQPSFPRCSKDVNPKIWDVAPWNGYKATSISATANDPEKCYDEYHSQYPAGVFSKYATYALYMKKSELICR